MPVNVNGNWNASGSFNFNTALDKNKYWRINTNTRINTSKSVGYLYRSRDKATVENHNRSANFNEWMRIT